MRHGQNGDHQILCWAHCISRIGSRAPEQSAVANYSLCRGFLLSLPVLVGGFVPLTNWFGIGLPFLQKPRKVQPNVIWEVGTNSYRIGERFPQQKYHD